MSAICTATSYLPGQQTMPPFSALDAGGRNNDPSMQAIRLSDPLSKTMPVPLTQQDRPNIPKCP